MMHAVESQLQAVQYLKLVIDLPQVVLDHLLGGADFASYVLVLETLRDTPDDQHLFFAEAQLLLRSSALEGLGTVGLDDPVHTLLIEPGLASGDFADATHQQFGGDRTRQYPADASPQVVHRLLFVGTLGYEDQFRPA